MFNTFPQSLMNAWTKFPMMGPNREYFEKMQKLQMSWSNFLQSNMEYNQIAQVFWTIFFQELPGYWQKSLASLQSDPSESAQKGLQFFDQCWEKTMQSKEYAEKSAKLLNNLSDFKANILEFFTPMLHQGNIASQQQIRELAKQVDELRKKVEELEAEKSSGSK